MVSICWGPAVSFIDQPFASDLYASNASKRSFSGQNIIDLKRFSEKLTSIDLLKRVLLYQHIAPTVPDTVDGFPFEDRDPLVIEDNYPHVFFAGNQSHAEFSTVEFENGRKTLLLSIPRFSRTKSVLLVNLRTLDVIEQSFDYENFD